MAGLVAVALAAGVAPRDAVASRAASACDNETENLIVNRSFETGLEVGDNGFVPLDDDSVELRGWVVTRGQLDLVGGKVAHGKRALDLHGSPGFGGVKQPFVTKVGQKYKVTFAMSGNPGVGHESVQMAVRAAGKKEVFEFDMAGVTLDDLKWEKKTWEFTATDTITLLEFHTAMTPTTNSFGGPLLDDVKVVAAD